MRLFIHLLQSGFGRVTGKGEKKNFLFFRQHLFNFSPPDCLRRELLCRICGGCCPLTPPPLASPPQISGPLRLQAAEGRRAGAEERRDVSGDGEVPGRLVQRHLAEDGCLRRLPGELRDARVQVSEPRPPPAPPGTSSRVRPRGSRTRRTRCATCWPYVKFIPV